MGKTPDLHTRAWLLLILDGIERVGMTPVSMEAFHSLVFLTNSLAPVYDLPPPDGRILKFERGPYYTVVQRDLDRLVGAGLVSVSKIEHFEDDRGWWLRAKFSLTRRGLAAVDHIVQLAQARKSSLFFSELMAAANIEENAARRLAEKDVNYEDSIEGTLIDFSEYKDNYAYLAARRLDDFVPTGVWLGSRGQLHLYLRYLKRILGAA